MSKIYKLSAVEVGVILNGLDVLAQLNRDQIRYAEDTEKKELKNDRKILLDVLKKLK